ncbi:MAG: tRNA (adenosine(37)-N6)-dimethylallyltransferase MiaA [Bacilli bacterium]|jgi:tRNA dimethylallyltransferase
MIFVIGGVTAAGKSSLAFKLAKAIGGIIINADAYAFYRELNIGTAKPTEEELASVPTFLFNNLSISDPYSIYDYQQDVRRLIAIYEQSKRPIILVGGSGLYIRAALYDYRLSPNIGIVIEDNFEESNASLHQRLTLIDPVAAAKIHPNNRKRVLRALAISENQSRTETNHERHLKSGPLFPFTMIVLDALNEVLERRIHERTTDMFVSGLRQEVNDICQKYPQNAQGLQAIGYKEILANPSMTDDELIALISLRTRQYAKRQRTFFRHQFSNATWFSDQHEAYLFLIKKYEDSL